jgi:hypothetical protein
MPLVTALRRFPFPLQVYNVPSYAARHTICSARTRGRIPESLHTINAFVAHIRLSSRPSSPITVSSQWRLSNVPSTLPIATNNCGSSLLSRPRESGWKMRLTIQHYAQHKDGKPFPTTVNIPEIRLPFCLRSLLVQVHSVPLDETPPLLQSIGSLHRVESAYSAGRWTG